MQVRALSIGFFGGRRRPGDVFDVPEGTKATWFAPVGETTAAPAEPVKQKPQALSERAGKAGKPQSMTEVLKGGAENLV